MYVILMPVQIKPGYRDRFVAEELPNARGAASNEPGCLRFDVIQDGEDPNRIWVYEVYKDEAAFETHRKTPHYTRFFEATKDWRVERPLGAGRGAYNIWPSDQEWK